MSDRVALNLLSSKTGQARLSHRNSSLEASAEPRINAEEPASCFQTSYNKLFIQLYYI